MNEVTKITANTQADVIANDPMVDMIERVAMNPDLPMERVTALMDMRERQMNKEAEQVFNQAFAAAMAEMPDVPRSGNNTHLKNKYSTLDDLIRTVRPVLSRHGLSLNWQANIESDVIHVRAIVRHAQGHSISTDLSGPRDTGKAMNALQASGSTETYLKRYTGFGILGLSSGDEVDDDAQTASAKGLTAQQFKVLSDLITETKTDEATFHKAFGWKGDGIPDLTNFPVEKFDQAVSMLEKKKAKVDA